MATDYDKYPHYFKVVPEGVTHIDVYGVLRLFDVKSQEIGHAIKKLLVPGVRGTKSKAQDIQEAIDTLERWKQLNREFEPKPEYPEPPGYEVKHNQLDRTTQMKKPGIAFINCSIKTEQTATSSICGGNCSSCTCNED